MVEAMVALTLMDALMMQQAQCELFPSESQDINPMGKTARGRPGGAPVVAGAHADAPKAVDQRIDEE